MRGKFRRQFTIILLAAAGAAGLLWAAAGLPGELNLKEEQARQSFLSALVSGQVPVYEVRKPMQAAPPALRVTLIQGVLEWAKAYSESAEFAAAYAEMRSQAMPAAPEPRGTVEEEIARERAKMEQQIEETRKMVASLPAEQQPAMEEAIQSMVASMKQMYDDPEMRPFQVQMIEASRADEQQRYETAVEKWKENFPEDPRTLIARRLQAFLAVSAEVDFSAKVEEVKGKMRFVEEAYEEKPGEWKLCYRAGKEPVAAARTFAGAWLAGLPKN